MLGRTNVISKGKEDVVLTGDAYPSEVLSGKTFYSTDANNKKTGTMTNNGKGDMNITPSSQVQYFAIQKGYYNGSGNVCVEAVPTQTKTVTPSTSVQNVTPDSGKFLSKVTVNAIPASAKTCVCLMADVISSGLNDPNVKYSNIVDTGNNNNKGVFACGHNMAQVAIQGSNDNSTYTDIVSGSSNGSNSGANGTPFIIQKSNTTYRYFRAKYQGYNNGGANIAQWAIFTS